MPTFDPHATLAELVTSHPGLAADLDRLGLDYCCGGQRRLTDAAEAAGLDLHDVLGQLGSADSQLDAADWSTMPPAELVDHLETTHHAYLRGALPRLTALADKVATVHGERHPELVEVQRLITTLRADLEPHLLKEEQVLFPMIRELATGTSAPTFHCGTLENPIRVMATEHDAAGELLAQLRPVTGDYNVPDDGCTSYQAFYRGLAELEADTHLHVHKENNVLFPAVLEAERTLAVP